MIHRFRNELSQVPEEKLQRFEEDALVLNGEVVAVSIDGKHRFRKLAQSSITLEAGHGIKGDAHYGRIVRHRYLSRRNPKAPNLRQVHLIPNELFGALRIAGFEVYPGDLGENITTAGLDLERLPLGTVLWLGNSAALELTGLRTPCILIDRFKAGLKAQLFGGATGPRFRAGVMAIVKEGGMVEPGNRIRAMHPPRPYRELPAL